MFIKLTRLDGQPIWINAAFVVTIEPRKGGGSVVVPVGDGLDYDVSEPPASVLALLDGAPAPAILPVPTSDALAPTPADVAPESIGQLVAEARQTAEAQKTPAPKAEGASAEKPAEAGADEEADEGKPAKAAKGTRKTATPKKPRATRKKKPAPSLPEDQVARLRKMAPGTVKKLLNTLQTQFKVEDAAAVVQALEAGGVVSLDGTRVSWPPEMRPPEVE